MELVVIALMLAVNAVFAAYEMALASVSRARLEVLMQSGARGSRSAVRMKERLEGSLAVIQLGITLAGAIAAATGGAAVDTWFAPRLMDVLNVSARAAGTLALVLLVVPLSALTIVFAELVPKMIGIRNKEGVVLALSPAMRVVSVFFYPVVAVFETLVKRVMRVGERHLAGGKNAEEVSGLLELRAAASLARATRIIGPMEERIVMSAARLSEQTVAEVMVPERDIAAIPAAASMTDALIEAHMHMHTRYPVCTEPGNAQSITGYVTFKDIVTSLRTDPRGSGLRGIIRQVHRIPVNTTLAQALTVMIQDRVHIAIAMDGEAVRGLITMDDMVAVLVGDIHNEYERLPSHLSKIGEWWLAGGGVHIADLDKALGGTVPASVDRKLTLADLVRQVHEAQPRSGDVIECEGFTVQVRKVRRNRVAEAVVRPAKQAGDAGNSQ